jgi:hypothetical protein
MVKTILEKKSTTGLKMWYIEIKEMQGTCSVNGL